MKTGASELDAETPGATGFGTLDEKGRVSLPKAVRSSLGLHPGSSLAYIVLDHAVLLVPQDERLAEIQREAVSALAEAGLTADDLLARLPQARVEMIREAYGADFLARLEALHRGAADLSSERVDSAESADQAE